MTRELICIVCPMGCHLTATIDGDTVQISGNTCPRGARYGIQEITAPERTVTSSIAVCGSRHKLCPVKTSAPIPKEKVDDALCEIRKIQANAPLSIGDVIIENVAGTGVSVVATAVRSVQ